MKYNYSKEYYNKGDIISVELDKQANVILLDTNNYTRFKQGRKYSYYGGRATQSPFYINVPSTGIWYLVINLGGYAGTVKYSVKVSKNI